MIVLDPWYLYIYDIVRSDDVMDINKRDIYCKHNTNIWIKFSSSEKWTSNTINLEIRLLINRFKNIQSLYNI